MILLLGDIHGDYKVLERSIRLATEAEATAIIQVGDFCLFHNSEMANNIHFQKVVSQSKVPIYFIDGNHDDCDRWCQLTEITKVFDDGNLFYIPRGTVMELDGRTIAFMGGAASIDMKWRLQSGAHWTEKENITEEETNRLLENVKDKKIDLFITHSPTKSAVDKHFNPKDKLFFEVGIDWIDPAQLVIEDLWGKLGHPNIYSGHMHRRVIGENYRILDVDELLAV